MIKLDETYFKLSVLICILLMFFSNYAVSQTGTNAEVLNYDQTVEISKNRLFISVSVSIRINNAEGQYMSKVSIPFSASNKINNLNAFLTDKSGNEIKKLKKKDVIDVSSISGYSLYEDDIKKEFELNHNRYPYILNYSYTTSYSSFLTVADWTPVISLNVNTLKSVFVGIANSSAYISTQYEFIPASVNIALR
uniref:DUF3857 domain-containing protein n=1 Tax=Roseivirga sp. TaxID=1964215 RepID=UPI004048CE95